MNNHRRKYVFIFPCGLQELPQGIYLATLCEALCNKQPIGNQEIAVWQEVFVFFFFWSRFLFPSNPNRSLPSSWLIRTKQTPPLIGVWETHRLRSPPLLTAQRRQVNPVCAHRLSHQAGLCKSISQCCLSEKKCAQKCSCFSHFLWRAVNVNPHWQEENWC